MFASKGGRRGGKELRLEVRRQRRAPDGVARHNDVSISQARRRCADVAAAISRRSVFLPLPIFSVAIIDGGRSAQKAFDAAALHARVTLMPTLMLFSRRRGSYSARVGGFAASFRLPISASARHAALLQKRYYR